MKTIDTAISERGHALYENQLKQNVEQGENIGKIIAIDIESGDYEIDTDLLTAGFRLKARHPDAILWSERIGYNAVYALGAGTLARTDIKNETVK
jgi:hypothetical protein